MDIKSFCKQIELEILEIQHTFTPELLSICDNLSKLFGAFCSQEKFHVENMTQVTILFEAFYQFVNAGSLLKTKFNLIRLERWKQHYGTPTVTFLVTYHKEIKSIKELLIDNAWHEIRVILNESIESSTLVYDSDNQVKIDINKITKITNAESEKPGQFVKTHNPQGGYTTAPCDFISKRFMEYVGLPGRKAVVLEIGAAFGAASLQALKRGAQVFCNDIDSNNLAVVKNRYNELQEINKCSSSGDNNNLILVPGCFPEDLRGLKKNFFNAILICRVLHFFTGKRITAALQQLLDQLKPGGKIFIVCETPYLKNWQKFIPIFEKRARDGVDWPGEITNPAEYESSGRSTSLPDFVHWLSKDVLEKCLLQANFEVDLVTYLNRAGQFPSDMLLDGRESVGAIATKPKKFLLNKM